ncbi:MAG: hypothetical protein EOP49_22575 [Sphingobacteriales bacterium]|nr:MAG: hypothetical protein EOP49_22575 [Sphingobacteriales bacterium]
MLHWPDASVSVLQGGWGTILTFAAIILAGKISDKIGPKKMQITVMWGICLYLLALSAGSGYWNNDLFSGTALVMWNLADPLLSVAVFPILMGLCLDKVEGSQFTAYLALVNLCDVSGSYLTGWALHVTSAPVLSVCCGLLLLIILVYMKTSGNYKVIPG